MEKLEFAKPLRTSIYNKLQICKEITARNVKAEDVHDALQLVTDVLKEAIKERNKFLKENNLSIINLMTVKHSTTLDANGSVFIKIDEHVISIAVAKGVNIENNFNPYRYSIVKINNKQEIYYSSDDDYTLYNLISLYQNLKSKYEYKIGNRIHIKTFEGMYQIIAIDHTHVTITCNKWKTLGKPDKKVLLEDIKCLAGGFNSLTYIKNK